MRRNGISLRRQSLPMPPSWRRRIAVATTTAVLRLGDLSPVHGFGMHTRNSPLRRIHHPAATAAAKATTATSRNENDPSPPLLDLLVIGAGPTGLTAAAEAKRMGLSVRIVDRKYERSTHDSRALVVHPRVMELLNGIGDDGDGDGHRVTDRLIERGYKLRGLNFHPGTSSEPIKVPMDEGRVRFGDAAFPFLTFLPQYYTESELERELEKMGGTVEWGKSIQSITQDDDMVHTTLLENSMDDDANADAEGGSIETISSRYVVGCDGGRSKTRDLLNISMDRARSKFYFVIADITFREPIQYDDEEVCAFMHPDGVTALFPLPTPLTYRMGALAPSGITDETDPSALNAEFLNGILHSRTPITEPFDTGRFAKVFEITHGIADTYRRGRAFLAGDSAHVHSPVGGQGMNYGMTDAVNLIWKLAWSERCRRAGLLSDGGAARATHARHAVDRILESYNTERRSVGKSLLENTERGTFIVATDNVIVQKVRDLFASVLLPWFFPSRVRSLGQLTLPCSRLPSPILCDDVAGGGGPYICRSGDRLPNIRLVGNEENNNDKEECRLYDSIDRQRHTWVVLNPDSSSSGDDDGADDDRIREGAEHVNVVRAIPSDEQDAPPYISTSALKRRQVILVRPDLFVAGVGESIEDVRGRMENLLDREVVALM